MRTESLAGRVADRGRLAGVEIDASLASALAEYVGLLYRWNRGMNLTGLSEDDSGLDRLVIEPLLAAKQIPVGTQSLVDIGSGGGSPAVPLKLAMPSLGLWMVESKTRKAAFLREVVRQFSLEDVVVHGCRYQDLLTREERWEMADLVTIRAVKINGEALVRLRELLKVDGKLFLFQSTRADDVWSGVPCLRWLGSYPLMEPLKSQLVVLEKV
ncbi:MAG: 16S rRNA (guanine(527)-N(7))-methyltransferase RsmG [Acidobacteriota bacterium]|nr:16S rRNA (guanine(527)-N(7))-methyltransferase RsmG [Acidobacteriota bacterium]